LAICFSLFEEAGESMPGTERWGELNALYTRPGSPRASRRRL